ncbi:BTB/POZ domain-containing protein 3-like [Paramacrobiotus metropolitanus]|uniref:BTB/POZ domain-containing protein 3-like n=1 Tax=Paramacrobiotus metropolitanus TaxID=2943436 RepID=UPI0024464057|nr:BTB/POZ domain-containing protein 3-like [Paramacrobiotus metropolitanus]
MSESSIGSSGPDNRGEAARVAECLKQVLSCGDMSDVQFAVGREYGAVRIFPAHRVIMGARSAVFHNMFYGRMPENCTLPVEIPDIHPDAFDNMLSYIYADTIDSLNLDNVFRTLICADKCDLPRLVDKCIRFILDHLSENKDSCFVILDMVIRYKCPAPSVMNECLRLIDRSKESVWQSTRFSDIGLETLEIVLKRETLDVDEATIYSSVEKWAASAFNKRTLEASAINRREMLGPAVYLVRFPVLTDAQLMNGPAQDFTIAFRSGNEKKTGLLLQPELWDIFRYKHADIKPELPFCAEPRRNDLRGVVHFTVPDIRKLGEMFTLSDPIIVRKLPWRIMIKKHLQKGWGYFVKCDGDVNSDSWKCQADTELFLLPWKSMMAPITRFFVVKDLLDPSKGYVNPSDFLLKLQVKLTADLPAGID